MRIDALAPATVGALQQASKDTAFAVAGLQACHEHLQQERSDHWLEPPPAREPGPIYAWVILAVGPCLTVV